MRAIGKRLMMATSLLVALAASASAQRTPADSTQEFASLPETTQVRQLNAEAWALRRNDATQAIAIGHRSLDLARRIGFRAGEAQILNYLGVAYQWIGENKQASRYFFQALGVADSAGVLLEQGYALNNISALLLLDGDGAQALTFARRALELQTRTQDRNALAYAHSRLSEVTRFLGHYDESIEHARTAHQIWMQLHDTVTGLTALRNVALGYEGKEEYADALSQLLDIVRSDATPALTRMHIYGDIARLSLRVHRPDQAIAYGLLKVQGGAGDAEVMRYLAEAYAAKRDWPRAYQYSTRETELQDSVARQVRVRLVRDLQNLYEITQAETENTALRRELRLSLSLAASTGALLLLLGYLGTSLLRKRRMDADAARLLSAQLVRIQASEGALAESSRQQRAILDNVPDAMWVKDVEGHYTAVNEAFSRFFDRPMNDIVGKSAATLFPLDDVQLLIDQEVEAILGGTPSRAEREFTLRGVPRFVETTVSPVLDAEGRLLGTTGIARDITERRRADQALLDSERRFRAIFDQTFQFIGLLDLEGRVIEANRTAMDFAGLAPEAVLGKLFWETPWWTHSPELQERLRQAVRGAAVGEFVRFEATHPGPGGRLHYVDFSLKPVRDQAGKVVMLMPEGRDITERKEAEDENRRLQLRMVRAQKLESLSVLAGGVAHDFNNLLAGIMGNAELARAELPKRSKVGTALDAIERAALRAATLSRKMLAYTGKTNLDRKVLDLSAMIRQMAGTVAAELPSPGTLHLELADDLPTIQGDAEQIGQAIMSLITNACEALGDRPGTVTLRTRRATLTAAQLAALESPEGLTTGEYLVLEVADTGEGMSEETRARIFDPFFSTKFAGRGLSLAAALGIARAHNGAIHLESELGKGSRFDLYLPVAGDPSTPSSTLAGRAASPAPPPLGTAERKVILVVDDEPDVLSVLQRVVERAGYTVLTATDGLEAVAMVRQHSTAISLVVLDLLMPRLDGAGAMQAIRRLIPGLPIVISSGFGGEAAADAALQGERVEYLRKPYPITDLVAAIRRLLAERDAPVESRPRG